MSLMRNSLVASGAIFACRLTGMAREIVYTSLFGATGALDAFYTAFRIPNLLRDLFAEGALSQSYTSVASKTREAQGEAAAWELTNKVATQLSSLMIAIVTLGILFAGPVMEALYSGDHSLTEQLFATDLSRIMWPFIGFASLSALIMGALNMVGVFGLPMLASAAFNVTSILLGLLIGYFIDPSFGPKALYGFACGVTIGGMAQIAVQLPKLSKTGFRWKPNFQWDDPRVRKIWGLMLPSVLASGVTQFTIFINTGFALDLQKGSVTAHGVPPLAASRGALRSRDGHGGAARCFPHDGGRRQKRGGGPHRQGVAAGGILCGTRFSHPLHPGNGIRLRRIPVGPLQPGGRALYGGSAGSLFPGPAGLCRDQGGAARLPGS